MARMNLLRGFTLILLAAGMTFCSTPAAADAVVTFKAKCAMCHGADGKGDTPAGKATKVKDFHSLDVVKETDAELQEVIQKGRNKMPSYQGKLSSDEVQELVKYIRQLQK